MAVKAAKRSVKAVKAVKKSVKKAVKKAPAYPRRPRMTLEEFIAATERSRKETDAAMKRSRLETEAAMAKSRKETDAAMERSRLETEAAMAKSRAETDKAIQRTTDNIAALSAKIDKLSDKLDGVSDNVGGVNRRLGQIIEVIIAPYLRLDLNAKGGHNFEDMRGNRKVNVFAGDRKETVAEMDIFLYGPAETMAVEIKTHMKKSDVAKHLERLKTLRLYETEAEINGKKLFGGMIGISVDDDARKFAKKNGLYVIGIHEKEDKLLIDAPEQCQVW